MYADCLRQYPLQVLACTYLVCFQFQCSYYLKVGTAYWFVSVCVCVCAVKYMYGRIVGGGW